MKRLFMMVLLIGCLVFAASSLIFAEGCYTGPTGPITDDVNTSVNKSIDLTAKVGPWAFIWFGDPDVLNFKGFGGEVKVGSVCFYIETNCDAWVRGIGTPFTKNYEGKDYSIKTWYKTCPADDESHNWTAANAVDPDAPDVMYPFGVQGGKILYMGQLGGVNDQPAGTYAASYKLIVWHPMNVN